MLKELKEKIVVIILQIMILISCLFFLEYSNSISSITFGYISWSKFNIYPNWVLENTKLITDANVKQDKYIKHISIIVKGYASIKINVSGKNIKGKNISKKYNNKVYCNNKFLF